MPEQPRKAPSSWQTHSSTPGNTAHHGNREKGEEVFLRRAAILFASLEDQPQRCRSLPQRFKLQFRAPALLPQSLNKCQPLSRASKPDSSWRSSAGRQQPESQTQITGDKDKASGFARSVFPSWQLSIYLRFPHRAGPGAQAAVINNHIFTTDAGMHALLHTQQGKVLLRYSLPRAMEKFRYRMSFC